MKNSAKKIQATHVQRVVQQEEQVVVAATATDEENVVEFVARSKKIAQQSEDACKLACAVDFDEFEEKYGISQFA